MKKLLSFLMLAIAASGCSRIGFVVANSGTDMPNVAQTSNLAYGEHPDQRLDIYSPNEGARPIVLVYFYGGGWRAGEKEKYRFVAHRFTREGYHVVIPDYRKYPDVTFPGFVEDTAAAIAKVKKTFPDAKIFVMGHSAGAYNSIMAIADPKYLAAQGMSQNDITGAIGISGPYNFDPSRDRWAVVFNRMDDYTPMKVNSYVERALPPTLLLQGGDDFLVGEENAEGLTKALKAQGSDVRYINYPEAGHFDIVGAFTLYWENRAPTAEDSIAFIEDIAAKNAH